MVSWTLSCRRREEVDNSPGPTSVREPMEMTGEQLEQFRGYLLLLARYLDKTSRAVSSSVAMHLVIDQIFAFRSC